MEQQWRNGMTRVQENTTRLTTLADLGTVFGIAVGEELDASPTAPPEDSGGGPIVSAEHGGESPADSPTILPDLRAVLADLDAAGNALAAITRQDGAAREAALGARARYDA